MLKAQQTEWFNNTICVVLGDHGKIVGNPESEMPDSYNHIPVMIYSSHIQPKEITKLGGQIDIASVLLDILDIDYNKIDFGINLLDEERPCMFYTADNMIGCRNNDYLFIYSPKDEMEFYYQLSS